MSVVALMSVKGAPGVTTLACAIGAVWPIGRDIVIAECDPAGGDLAARFGLSAEVGMTSLALSLRHRGDGTEVALESHVQRLPGGLGILCGPVGADAGRVVDGAIAGADLAELDTDVIADCGRLGTHVVGQGCIVSRADRVVILIRPESSAIAQGRWAVDRIAALDPIGLVGLLVAGVGVYEAADVADALGVELLGVVPRDPGAAAMLRGEPGANRALARSPLVLAASKLVEVMVEGPADSSEREFRDVG